MIVKSIYKNCYVKANGVKYNFDNYECNVSDPKALEEMRTMQAVIVPDEKTETATETKPKVKKLSKS
jgi:hypothetical protein